LVGEASIAGLAAIRGDTSEVYTGYGAGTARVVDDPTDPPDGNLKSNLPNRELYLLIDVDAYVSDDGEDPVQVIRVAYQANVLVARSKRAGGA
jgi:hypothetical protein